MGEATCGKCMGTTTKSDGMPEELARLADGPRVRLRRGGLPLPGGRSVVYWMQRAMRVVDNPALNLAVEVANLLDLPVVVYFQVIPNYPHANLRHYHFLAQGLRDVADEACERGIGFVVRRTPDSLKAFLEEVGAALLIGDENPCREPERWRKVLAGRLRLPFWTVDADVVVPSAIFNRNFVLLHHFRPHLRRELPKFLVAAEKIAPVKLWKPRRAVVSFPLQEDVTCGFSALDRSVAPVDSFTGGTRAALKRLKEFVNRDLAAYDETRNHPELAVLFVRHEPNYDNWECAAPWARKTLLEHAGDERPHRYSLEQLERGETHDELWNAAQREMLVTGWMHNYMRMYWGKKILEWAPDPATAFDWAVMLNDRYQLDGRDPNGYAGIAWAIVGRHDRPWFNRPVFGLVRSMTAASTAKKFDSKAYIRKCGGY